jgi:hypothetical protein
MPATRVRRVCRRCRVYVRGVLHRLYTAAALLWCTSTRLVYGYMSLACVAVGSEAVTSVGTRGVGVRVSPYFMCAGRVWSRVLCDVLRALCAYRWCTLHLQSKRGKN